MSSYSSRLVCVLLLGVMIFSPLSVKADEGVLPAEIFSAIMLKALNYDRNVDRQAKDKVIIGIVYMADDAQAQNFVFLVKE